MVDNRRTMAQPKTYARLLFAALLFFMFTGSSTVDYGSKTFHAKPSTALVRSSPAIPPDVSIELSKTGPGGFEFAKPQPPESLRPAAGNDFNHGTLEALAGLRQDEQQEMSQYCLALNVYWEARNQAVSGQLAVAQVTMNRVRDPRYPNDICEVVFDHKQFSWYWDGLPDYPREIRAWENALMVASAAIHGSGHADLDHVTHYHAVYSQPYWKDFMTLVATIGDHQFYRE